MVDQDWLTWPQAASARLRRNRLSVDHRRARVRRLTPLECERLQGFPDDWTRFGEGGQLISDSQRYRLCGNAVTTTVVSAVMTALRPCLEA